MRRWRDIPGLACRIACVLALVLVAFAHRPAVAPASAPLAAELAAYVLPDGTVPDLCLPGEEDHGGGLSGHCEFCRIAASVLLPAPPSGVAAVLLHGGERLAASPQPSLPGAPRLEAASPRAPPISLPIA